MYNYLLLYLGNFVPNNWINNSIKFSVKNCRQIENYKGNEWTKLFACQSLFKSFFFLHKLSFLRNRPLPDSLSLCRLISLRTMNVFASEKVLSMRNHLWMFCFCSALKGATQGAPWQFIVTRKEKEINPRWSRLLIIFPESSLSLSSSFNCRIQIQSTENQKRILIPRPKMIFLGLFSFLSSVFVCKYQH